MNCTTNHINCEVPPCLTHKVPGWGLRAISGWIHPAQRSLQAAGQLVYRRVVRLVAVRHLRRHSDHQRIQLHVHAAECLDSDHQSQPYAVQHVGDHASGDLYRASAMECSKQRGDTPRGETEECTITHAQSPHTKDLILNPTRTPST